MKRRALALLVLLVSLVTCSVASARPFLHVSSNESFASARGSGLRTVGWSPTWNVGFKLWLVSTRGVTLNGSTVSGWADQSGSGVSFTQGTASAQPTYSSSDAGYGSRPTLAFAAANSKELLATMTAIVQPFTVYVVGESTSGATQGRLVGGAGANTAILWDGAHYAYYAQTASVASTNTARTAQAFGAVFNGASSHFYINKSSATAADGNPGIGGWASSQAMGSSGGVNFLTGKIAEVIVYTGIHTQAQVFQVFQYLSNSYGIAGFN